MSAGNAFLHLTDSSTLRVERFRTLLDIYRALLGPVEDDPAGAERATHTSVSSLKWALERDWLDELADSDYAPTAKECADPVSGMRVLAARTRIPEVYQWVAQQATDAQLRRFIAAEGGPDGGFDDLVAVAQLGLRGEPKLELATNYWDEMGNGALADVHTDLHRASSRTMNLQGLSVDDMSEAGLERAALGGLLATNHWLQPEMLGALGMIELQAGPRCQQVLKGMHRLAIPEQARPFYEVHAEVDPRHGADWLTHVIAPMSRAHPTWGRRIMQGARWRLLINDRFLEELLQMFRDDDLIMARSWG